MPGPREQVLSALGKALASVGHELNNIVGVVQSYAAFIQEGKDPNATADAQVIRSTSEKAALIARQLLAFGHPREQDAEALELQAFLLDVQGFLRRALGEECPLVLELGAAPAVVYVRRALLGRTLLDLVLAVCAAAAPESELRLGVTHGERDGTESVELWLREERAVAPYGVNAASELVGVDLEGIRAALAAHGGTVRVGPGLSVSLLFPASGALPPPVRRTPSERSTARGTETVLVIEENAELRQAMCRMLEAAGFRALEAEDDATARSLALEGAVVVDLLLSSSSHTLDLLALAGELAVAHPSLTTLYQAKPFSSQELQDAVRGALDDRTRLSEQVPRDATRVLALLVDDDEHVRLGLTRILSAVGADVVTAPTGLHALQKLQALPIDLLIADQRMPGMDGTKLLETAYKTWPRVVRVVYTGYLSSGLVVDAVNRANVHKLLAKDMTPEWVRQQLAEVVVEIRRGRSALGGLP